MQTQPPVPAEYLRMAQAAAYTGLSQQFLRRAHRQGKGPERLRAGSKIIVYTREALDAWMRSRTETFGVSR